MPRDARNDPMEEAPRHRRKRKASPSIEAKYLRMLEVNDLIKRQQEEMRMLLERQNEEVDE